MEPSTHPVRFWRTLGRGIREAYDYLGTVLGVSALVVLTAILAGIGATAGVLALQGPRGVELARSLWRSNAPRAASGEADERLLGVAFVVALVAAWTLLGPLLAGIYGYVRQIVAREDPAPGDLFREVRRRWRSGLGLAAAQVVVGLMLLADLFFFWNLPVPALKWVGILFFYALLFWGLMLPYQWPLLVEGSPSPFPGGSRVPVVVKKSALLVLDNLPFSLGLGAFTLSFTLVCGITGIGLVLLWAGTLAFVYTIAARELLRKYGILPPEPVVEEE